MAGMTKTMKAVFAKSGKKVFGVPQYVAKDGCGREFIVQRKTKYAKDGWEVFAAITTGSAWTPNTVHAETLEEVAWALCREV